MDLMKIRIFKGGLKILMKNYLKKNFFSKSKSQMAGFTLIEMAIVLVIIGIIIGAVMKGRDLIKSAQIKNAYETFFAAHYKMIGSYYDKTGRILGDGTINGGTGTNPNGWMDNIGLYNGTNRSNIINALKSVGIDVCSLVKSNLTSTECGPNGLNIGQISLDGEYARQTVWVGYYYANFAGRYRNYLRIDRIPTDFAIALDKMIDGVANCASGSFVVVPGETCNNGQWPDASSTPYVRAAWIVEF